MRLHHVVPAAVLAVAAALPAAAQFTQYVEPGSLPLEELPTKDALDQAMATARWHLGGLRLDPWFGLRNVGWVEGVQGQGSDFTATVGAGLHAFAGLGPKAVFTAHALPEYTWWKDFANRRAWNGRYGLGTFGFYNRLRFQALASANSTSSYVSSELEEPVNVSRDRLEAGLEANVVGHLALFASGEAVDYSYRRQDVSGPTGEQLVLLDRSETRARGGLRYYLSPDVSVGVGAETVSVEFDHSQRDRSSSGDAGLAELTVVRTRLRAHLVALFPELDPEPGSSFVPYDDTLGTFDVRWKPGAKLEWQLYGFRNLVYSLEEPSPYYTDERMGLALLVPLGWRANVRVFAEDGRDDYVATVDGASTPDRDLFSYGGGFSFQIDPKVHLGLYASRTDYTGHGRPDSSVTRIQATLVVGQGTGEWY